MDSRKIDRELARMYLKQLNTPGKTPVSLVMEIAQRLVVNVDFHESKELKWSNGMFKFVVILGDVKAVGVGSSKKEAKQNSAKELIKLIGSESESVAAPPSPQCEKSDDSHPTFATPSPSLHNAILESPCDRNVVGELQNLAAKNRWTLPDYTYEEPIGEAHSKTFTCLVKMMSGLQCTGVGSSKKAAKKRAAEQMLELLDESGDGYDQVDALSPMLNTPSSGPNNASEVLSDSDLEDFIFTSNTDSPSPARQLDFATEVTEEYKYDNLSQEKLESCSLRDGFSVEYIELPNKSRGKGQYQVFAKLTFTENNDKERYPIVTHGSGETREIAKHRAAERARNHLELLFSVQ